MGTSLTGSMQGLQFIGIGLSTWSSILHTPENPASRRDDIVGNFKHESMIHELFGLIKLY